MTRPQPANLAASVHQRLLNLSHATGEEFNFLLARYAIERLLYRLSQSRYAGQFVLKGALMFLVWDVPGQAFVHRNRIDTVDASLFRVVVEIAAFLLPPLQAAAEELSFSAIWEPGGPWIERA